MKTKKQRADQVLMEQMALETVELARALIMEGRVMCGDRKILLASEPVDPNQPLRVRGEIRHYVSRGAHKLRKAIEAFHIPLKDRVCIDVGSSTGGFTEIMLENGASRVYAVDVGYNLLDYRIRSHPNVTVMERVNARFLTVDDFDPRPSFGATDVSFISLKAILPPALSVLDGKDSSFVALIKPQFEALPEEVASGGIVRDPSVQLRVIHEIVDFVRTIGWEAIGLEYSPIQGTEGNIEFLLHIGHGDTSESRVTSEEIRRVVSKAYYNFMKSMPKGL